MQAIYLLLIAIPPQAPEIVAQAPLPPQAPEVRLWHSPVPCPPGMEEYAAATETQEIAVTDGRDRISRVAIRRLEGKWHQSGGMEGVQGFRSKKFRLLPRPVKTVVGRVQVKFRASNGRMQTTENWGLKRTYPNGTRFDDVLSNDDGQVFEHRTRYKDNDGHWIEEVAYENPDARPQGYVGLKVSCASCHDQAGTGEYGVGLVPGGDTVLSDPLDWSVWEGVSTEQPQAPPAESWQQQYESAPSYSSPRRGPIFRGRRGGGRSGGG